MRKITAILILAAIFSASDADSQARRQRDSRRPGPQVSTNFGLLAPQDPATLPQSKATIIMPERKVKTAAVAVLTPEADGNLTLAGGWEMADGNTVTASGGWLFDGGYDTSAWYNATVPGTVLTTLVEQGVYPDPYYGINNLAIPDDLCRRDWWYRIVFPQPPRHAERVWLVLDGINYSAGVWLNGIELGTVNGAFTRGRFEVTGLLDKENVLAVHIRPPNNPGIPHEQSSSALRGPNGGQLCLDGPTFISSEGWDWIPGIRDRNIGIWQNVRLEYTGDVTLGDFQVMTDLPLPDTSSAEITVHGIVTNHSDTLKTVNVEGSIEKILFSEQITIGAGESTKVCFRPVTIKNPRLWWPNGYGAQELYGLTLSVQDGGATTETRNIRFGIRELSYEITADTSGEEGVRFDFNPLKALAGGKPVFDNQYRRPVGGGVEVPCLLPDADTSLLDRIGKDGTEDYLVIKVNGVRIYCKGGNWGMDDGMKRVSRKRLEPYIRLHRDANYNMIRNWTGESTEKVFYDLCDEYGMLVWNDFWMSTEGYNLNPNDEDLFMTNALDVVRRFNNHPSIVVWCPRNEGYAPPALETRLNELIAEEDGTRLYHGNSRYLNLRPSGGWYYCPAEDYFASQAQGFNTELGTASVPTAETIRSFMPVEDQWPVGNDMWHFHDWHFGQRAYLAALDSLYSPGTGLDDFCRKAQMVNYDSHRAMFESWNSRLWNSTCGLLLWMTHPAWPSLTWQTYSWDYETFGSYFGSMKACEPLHIQMNADTRNVVVVNASPTTYRNLVAQVDFYDMSGRRLGGRKTTLKEVPAGAVTDCFAGNSANPDEVYMIRLILRNGTKTLSLNDYIMPGYGSGNMHALNDLPLIRLAARTLGRSKTEPDKTVFEVSNPSKTVAVAIKLNMRDTYGERILPAYFTDGYFNLLPGEKRTVSVDCNYAGEAALTADGYNVAQAELLKVKM